MSPYRSMVQRVALELLSKDKFQPHLRRVIVSEPALQFVLRQLRVFGPFTRFPIPLYCNCRPWVTAIGLVVIVVHLWSFSKSTLMFLHEKSASTTGSTQTRPNRFRHFSDDSPQPFEQYEDPPAPACQGNQGCVIMFIFCFLTIIGHAFNYQASAVMLLYGSSRTYYHPRPPGSTSVTSPKIQHFSGLFRRHKNQKKTSPKASKKQKKRSWIL